MATYVPAKRGVEYIFYVSLVQQADTKLFQSNPTLAAGDVTISKDGGAFANLTTLPTVTPASGKSVKVTVSNTEMTADNVLIVFSDAAGAQWCDLSINIQTAARQIDDLAYPATSGRSMVVDAAGLVDANTVKIGPTGSGTAQTARDVGGNVDVATSTRMATYTQPTGFLAATFPLTVASTTNITAGTITTVTNLTNAPTAGDLTATMKASVNAEVDTALADINLDHLVGTATGIPAVPAGTYLDQIMDDGTAVFDRTTDSLQAIRDNMSAGAGDWTATEKENIRHALGVDGTKTAPTTGYGRIGDTTALTDLATGLGAVKAKTDNLPTDPADQSLVDAAIAAVQADTDNIQTRLPAALVGGRMDSSVGAMASDTLTAAALAVDAVTEIVTGVLTTQMTESYAADGVAPTLAQSLFQLLGREYEFSISGDTLTVKKLDGTTTAMTFTLAPPGGPYSSITRAT